MKITSGKTLVYQVLHYKLQCRKNSEMLCHIHPTWRLACEHWCFIWYHKMMACGDIKKKVFDSLNKRHFLSCWVESKSRTNIVHIWSNSNTKTRKEKIRYWKGFFPFAKNEFTATTHATLCALLRPFHTMRLRLRLSFPQRMGCVEFSVSVHMMRLRQHHQPLHNPLVAISKSQSPSYRVSRPLRLNVVFRYVWFTKLNSVNHPVIVTTFCELLSRFMSKALSK